METVDISEWAVFFAAEAGAAAALAGLLFVAMSINAGEIVKYPTLPGRAGETVVMLIGALIAASVTLIPRQSTRVLGLDLLVVGAVAWIIPVTIQVRGHAQTRDDPEAHALSRYIVTQAATLPAIVGAVILLGGSTAGLYFVAGGILLGFAVAVLNAWVLLIEILR